MSAPTATRSRPVTDHIMAVTFNALDSYLTNAAKLGKKDVRVGVIETPHGIRIVAQWTQEQYLAKSEEFLNALDRPQVWIKIASIAVIATIMFAFFRSNKCKFSGSIFVGSLLFIARDLRKLRALTREFADQYIVRIQALYKTGVLKMPLALQDTESVETKVAKAEMVDILTYVKYANDENRRKAVADLLDQVQKKGGLRKIFEVPKSI